MKKTLHVLRHEILTTLKRRSYILVTIGIPILSILIFGTVTIIKNRSPDESTNITAQGDIGQSESNELDPEGYVDRSGTIKAIPPDIPDELLIAFPDEESAKRALKTGNITAYYVIPQNYVETGDFYYVRPDYTPLSSKGQDWLMRWTLLYNLVDGDVKLASYIWHPMNVKTRNLSLEAEAGAGEAGECLTPGYTCESNTLVSLLPMIVLILFFVLISTSAGLMLRSVSAEKQDQTMETLLLSISPREMLGGKVIGLGIVAILQVLLWAGSGFIILRIGGRTLNLPPGFSLPPTLLVWGMILFIGGYAIYASLMAGLGALVPDIKAATQASFIITLPLLAGYMISIMPPVQESPHGLLATTLSIFPLTAPIVMMMRLTVGGVPTWQLLLTIGLMLITIILVVRAVAGMFHAQTILSGQPFSPKRYFKALFGQE